MNITLSQLKALVQLVEEHADKYQIPEIDELSANLQGFLSVSLDTDTISLIGDQPPVPVNEQVDAIKSKLSAISEMIEPLYLDHNLHRVLDLVSEAEDLVDNLPAVTTPAQKKFIQTFSYDDTNAGHAIALVENDVNRFLVDYDADQIVLHPQITEIVLDGVINTRYTVTIEVTEEE